MKTMTLAALTAEFPAVVDAARKTKEQDMDEAYEAMAAVEARIAAEARDPIATYAAPRGVVVVLRTSRGYEVESRPTPLASASALWGTHPDAAAARRAARSLAGQR